MRFIEASIIFSITLIVMISLPSSFSEGPPTFSKFSGETISCSPDGSLNEMMGWSSTHIHVKGEKAVVHAKIHSSIYEENGKLLGKINFFQHFVIDFEKDDRISRQNLVFQCTDGKTATLFVLIEVAKDGTIIKQKIILK